MSEDSKATLAPTTKPLALPPVQCTAAALSVPLDPAYEVQPGATHCLVAVDYTARFTRQQASLQEFTLPPQLLPFGLVDRITVCGPPDARPFVFQLVLHKLSGVRESRWLPAGRAVSMTHAALAVDFDATHRHFKDVRRTTGHLMTFRAIAGAAVLNLQVKFRPDTELPAWFDVVYHTVNAVRVDLSVAAVRAALAAREPLEFLLKPLQPAQRKLEAVQNLEDKSHK